MANTLCDLHTCSHFCRCKRHKLVACMHARIRNTSPLGRGRRIRIRKTLVQLFDEFFVQLVETFVYVNAIVKQPIERRCAMRSDARFLLLQRGRQPCAGRVSTCKHHPTPHSRPRLWPPLPLRNLRTSSPHSRKAQHAIPWRVSSARLRCGVEVRPRRSQPTRRLAQSSSMSARG